MLRVVYRMAAAGRPPRPEDLSAYLGITPGTAKSAVSVLRRAGYVLETELAAFAAASAEEQAMLGLGTEESLEAHTFVLFERVMQDLETLYDPTPSAASPDKQPEIACTSSFVSDPAKFQPANVRKHVHPVPQPQARHPAKRGGRC